MGRKVVDTAQPGTNRKKVKQMLEKGDTMAMGTSWEGKSQKEVHVPDLISAQAFNTATDWPDLSRVCGITYCTILQRQATIT
jgi:hypothetical protein